MESGPDKPVVVAQFSDLHVTVEGRDSSGIDAAARLSRCIAHLAALDVAPDLLVLSGDLVDRGSLPEYRRLRALLAGVRIPLCLMPGNHDRRAPLREVFAGHDYLGREGRMFYHRDLSGLRVIALDSLVEGSDGGDLDAAQLRWLDSLLRESPQLPALVLLHHPPVATGFSRMDRISVAAGSAEALGGILAAHPQVRAVLCGHVHRSVQAVWRGVQVSVCPSTAFQARLHLGRGRFEAAPGEPPAYLLHYWDGRNLATHTVII